MTTLLAASDPQLHTQAAQGAQSLAWLLIAFPLAGAAILLLGGRRTDKWGHLLGVAMSAGVLRRRLSPCSCRCWASPATVAAASCTLYQWISAGRSRPT